MLTEYERFTAYATKFAGSAAVVRAELEEVLKGLRNDSEQLLLMEQRVDDRAKQVLKLIAIIEGKDTPEKDDSPAPEAQMQEAAE